MSDEPFAVTPYGATTDEDAPAVVVTVRRQVRRLRRWLQRALNRHAQQTITLIETSIVSAVDDYSEPTYIEATLTLDANVSGFRVDEIDGDRIRRDDRKIMVSAEGVDASRYPTTSTKLLVDGRQHQVISVRAWPNDSAPVYFLIQARV